ncbi:16116_t:CDS:1, partial [Funneliformis geosporum]
LKMRNRKSFKINTISQQCLRSYYISSQSRHSSRMNNLRYSYYSLNSLLRKNTLVFHQKGKVQDTLVTHQVIHQ